FIYFRNSAPVAVGHHVVDKINPFGDEFNGGREAFVQGGISFGRAADFGVLRARIYNVPMAGFTAKCCKVAAGELRRNNRIDKKPGVGLTPNRREEIEY